MCSTGLDVSDQISTTRAEDLSILAESWPNENNAATSEVAIRHQLPNGLKIENTNDFNGALGLPPILMTSRSSLWPSGTVAFLDKNLLVMGMSILRAQYDPQKQWSNWADVEVTAVDCAL
jgi:hypothetical protein